MTTTTYPTTRLPELPEGWEPDPQAARGAPEHHSRIPGRDEQKLRELLHAMGATL